MNKTKWESDPIPKESWKITQMDKSRKSIVGVTAQMLNNEGKLYVAGGGCHWAGGAR